MGAPRHLLETPYQYAERQRRNNAKRSMATAAAGGIGGGAVGGIVGLLLGATVGAGLGAAVGLATRASEDSPDVGIAAVIGGVLFGFVGGVAGSIYGTYKGAAALAPEGEEHESGLGAVGGMIAGGAAEEATGIRGLGLLGTAAGAAYGAKKD